MIATLLSLSILTSMTGCAKSREIEGSSSDLTVPGQSGDSSSDPTDTSDSEDYSSDPTVTSDIEETKQQTFNTNSYELAIPTGTRVMSDAPDLPEEIVYWDPGRDLASEYTLEEATGKYAFVADRTTLIYNSCDELSMSHSFNCVDYGSRLFSNSNTAQCLDPDGNVHAGNITHLQLNVEENVSANTPFEEMAHDPMCYYRLPPQEFVIEEIEQADDHVIQHITETGTSREFLYYGKVMGNDLLLVTFENYNSDNTLTDTDIKDFVHYAEVLLGHLEPDDGSEPYLYDKLVNVPFIGGRYVTGFDHFISINGKTLGLETKKDTLIDYFTLVTDPEDSYLEKRDGMTDWEDENDIKMRESTQYSYYQEFVFTIGGTRYFCRAQNRDEKKIDVNSLDDLLKILDDCCYIK